MTRSLWYLALTVLLASTGCDSTEIDPFENDGRYFSVYGFLNPFQPEQTIRVVPVRRSLEEINDPSDAQAQINAEVYTVNLRTNQRTDWTHVLQRFVSGQDTTYGHLFQASFIPIAGETYELHVVRGDQREATATVTIPREQTEDATIPPLEAIGDSAWQPLILRDLPRPWSVTGLYFVTANITDDVWIPLPYEARGTSLGEDDWQFDLTLTADSLRLRQEILNRFTPNIQQNESTFVQVLEAGIRLVFPDPAWPLPEDLSNLDALAQPTTPTNIQNGYGYWGSFASFTYSWNLSPEAAATIDYPRFFYERDLPD